MANPEVEEVVEVEDVTTTEQRPTCLCGCGEPVSNRFLPGHDGKLRRRLYNQIRDGDDEARAKAEEALKILGWPMPAASKAQRDPKYREQAEAVAEALGS